MKAQKVILSILFITLSHLGFPQSNWTKIDGPYGQSTNKLYKNGTDIYACTNSGIYKSSDSALIWTSISQGFPRTPNVNAVLIHHNIMFAGLIGSGVYTSTDNGLNWKQGTLKNQEVLDFAEIGDTIFAATTHGLFCSPDNGASWTSVSSGLPSEWIYCLYVIGSNLYAGSSSALSVSTNKGGSWTTLYNSPVLSMVQYNSKLFVASTYFGVFESSDNGASWSSLGLSGLECKVIYASGSTLFVGTPTDVFTSSNQGANWSYANNGLIKEFNYSFLEIGANVLLGSETGVYKTNNYGSSWYSSHKGMNPDHITCLMQNGDSLFSTSQCGINLTTDYGKNWKLKSDGIDFIYMYKILHFKNILYSAGFNGLYKSIDGGSNWQKDMNATGGIIDIASNSRSIYAGDSRPQGNGMLRSDDNGVSWKNINNGLSNIEIRSIALKDDTIFAATIAGLFRSVDEGENWTQLTLPGIGPSSYIPYVFVAGSTYFAITSNLVFYRSVDGGNTWTLVPVGIVPYGYFQSIISDNGALYGGGSKGVFKSIDNGITWNSYSSGLNKHTVSCLLFINGKLHAGTEDGIFVNSPLTGVWEQQEQIPSFSAYPNPFNSQINLKALKGENNKVSIYDVSGKLMYSTILKGSEGNINLDHQLSRGMYLLQVVSEKGMEQIKILKK